MGTFERSISLSVFKVVNVIEGKRPSRPSIYIIRAINLRGDVTIVGSSILINLFLIEFRGKTSRPVFCRSFFFLVNSSYLTKILNIFSLCCRNNKFLVIPITNFNRIFINHDGNCTSTLNVIPPYSTGY